MYTVTLLTAPTAKTLDPSLVESLRNAWGGGDAVWLSPDEAAEFPVMTRPDNFDSVWTDLQGMGVDLCLQVTGGRRRKMLIADMDSTMIQQECIDELAAEAGVGEHVAAITAKAMNGELDFEGALTERVGLLKGLPASVIAKVLRERITLMPGGPELLATMKDNGAHCVLVSGGFTAFAGPVANRLGFDEYHANVLLQDGDILNGTVQHPILGREAKVETLQRTIARLGIDASQVMAVGDGANDLGMLSIAGAGVALHAKPSVQAQCALRVNHGDLSALLFLQGYARADFGHTAPDTEDFAV